LLTDAVPGNGHLLMIATAGLLAFTALRMAHVPSPAPATTHNPVEVEDPVGDLATPAGDLALAHEHDPDRSSPLHRRTEIWRLGLIGIAAGLLSGLLGIGGGVLMVPAFATWVRLSVKEAVATSLVCVGALAFPGMITHAALGNIDWAFAIPLSIAVIPGARLGAHLAIRSSERRLRLAVAIVLGSIAVAYATGELIALLA
jgi:uncharacterized membrane protein YfcA